VWARRGTAKRCCRASAALAPWSPADRALLARLVDDLPQVWMAATTTPVERKRMRRAVIPDVSRDWFSQAGHTRSPSGWPTGWVTTVPGSRPPLGAAPRRDARVVALMGDWAPSHADDRLAAILHQRGLVTPPGVPWTDRRVLERRRRHATRPPAR